MECGSDKRAESVVETGQRGKNCQVTTVAA